MTKSTTNEHLGFRTHRSGIRTPKEQTKEQCLRFSLEPLKKPSSRFSIHGGDLTFEP